MRAEGIVGGKSGESLGIRNSGEIADRSLDFISCNIYRRSGLPRKQHVASRLADVKASKLDRRGSVGVTLRKHPIKAAGVVRKSKRSGIPNENIVGCVVTFNAAECP